MKVVHCAEASIWLDDRRVGGPLYVTVELPSRAPGSGARVNFTLYPFEVAALEAALAERSTGFEVVDTRPPPVQPRPDTTQEGR